MYKSILKLQFIFNFNFWYVEHTYSKPLDKAINQLLDQGIRFTNISECYADLGHIRVWIANYPYAFCRLRDYMPSRLTCQRAGKVFQESMLESGK